MTKETNSMMCPECGHEQSKVQKGGPHRTSDSTAVLRRRRCSKCGHVYRTLEQAIQPGFRTGRGVNNRALPPVDSTSIPKIPAPTVLEDGRIGWPTVFEYKIKTPSGVYISPCPPRLHIDSERDPNPKSLPHPRDGATDKDLVQKLRHIGKGLHESPEATLGYEVLVYDLPVYDALAASGALADPRHRGLSAPSNGYGGTEPSAVVPTTNLGEAAPPQATNGER